MSGLALLSPGTSFAGDYRIVRPLREGGMGAVYVAEQISTSRRCALKVMQPELVNHPEARKRFLREAKIGAQLKSDFVVQVIQAGVDDATGMPWLAMELLEGEDLEAYVTKKGRLDAGEVVEIFDQLCDALGEAHSKGIVHRDLKPENIFLAPPRRRRDRFTIKVLDFGIARLLAEVQTTSSRTQNVMGTPLFMAPEQAQPGLTIAPFTDVWALGLIAFRLLTGRHFWRSATDPNATVMMLAMEAFVHPMAPASTRMMEWGLAGVLPEGFDTWFARCANRRPEERYSDAAQAFAALEQLVPLQRSSLPTSQDTPAPMLVTAPANAPPVTAVSPVMTAPAMSPPPITGPAMSVPAITGPAMTAPAMNVPAMTGPAQPSHGVTAPMPSPPMYAAAPPAPRSSSAVIFAAIGGVAVLGVVAAAFFVVRQSPSSSEADPSAPATATATAIDAPPAVASATSESPSDPPSSVASSDLPQSVRPASTSGSNKSAPSSPPSDPPPTPSKDPSAGTAAPTDTAPSTGARDFNRSAAVATLSAAAASAKGCKRADGPTGSAPVKVVFAPSGNVVSANVGPPFAGTPVGACIAAAFRSAHVPPFDGAPVSVSKTVNIN